MRAFSQRTGLIVAAAILTGLGLLAIFASSSIPASRLGHGAFYYVYKQAAVAALGFFLVFLIGHIPFRWIERMTLPVFLSAAALLAMVQIPGLTGAAKGAARWILIGGFSVQPGEIAKLALILFLAKSLSRKHSNLEQFSSGILPNLAAFMLLAILLIIQPDFGTVVLLFALTFLMLFVAGLPKRFISIGMIAALIAIAGAIAAAPYRLARLLSFLDPWSDMQAGGFQIIQSYLGFKKGELLGVGLGESRQKLFFLPEAHTDFILAVIGEELGLLGVMLVCLCFVYILVLGYQIAKEQRISYRRHLAFGITALISLQAIINIGVCMGLMPTKGMTLPFVSNGSNSLIVFLLAIAILARISQEMPNDNDAVLKSAI